MKKKNLLLPGICATLIISSSLIANAAITRDINIGSKISKSGTTMSLYAFTNAASNVQTYTVAEYVGYPAYTRMSKTAYGNTSVTASANVLLSPVARGVHYYNEGSGFKSTISSPH